MFKRFGQRFETGGDYRIQQIATKIILLDTPSDLKEFVRLALGPAANAFLNAVRQNRSLSGVRQYSVLRRLPEGLFRYQSNTQNDTLFITPSKKLLQFAADLMTELMTPCVVIHLVDDWNLWEGTADLTDQYSIRLTFWPGHLPPYAYFGNGPQTYQYTESPTPFTEIPLGAGQRPYFRATLDMKVGWDFSEAGNDTLNPEKFYRQGVGHRIFINATREDMALFVGDNTIWRTSPITNPNEDIGNWSYELTGFYTRGVKWVDHFVPADVAATINFEREILVTGEPLDKAAADDGYVHRTLTALVHTIGWRNDKGIFIPARRPVVAPEVIDYYRPERTETNVATLETVTYPGAYIYGSSPIRAYGLNYWRAYVEAWQLKYPNIPIGLQGALQYPNDPLDVVQQAINEAGAISQAVALAERSEAGRFLQVNVVRPAMADEVPFVLAQI